MLYTKEMLQALELIRTIPKPIPGIPWEFWSVNIETIRVFIERNRLVPMNHEELIGKKTSDVMYASRLIDLKEGGMRSPHLHYNGERYKLSPEQWNAFTRPILKEFANRLETAQNVTFDNFMEINSAINK